MPVAAKYRLGAESQGVADECRHADVRVYKYFEDIVLTVARSSSTPGLTILVIVVSPFTLSMHLG